MGSDCFIIGFIGIVIICWMGAAAGGGVLIWQSTIRTTCSDWSVHSEFIGWNCYYTTVNLIYQCQTVCTCQRFFDYQCLPLPPVGGISPGFMTGGIILVLACVATLIMAIVYLCCMWRR